MPRRSGDVELDPVKKGVLLDATLNHNVPNRQAAKLIGKSEGTVRNVLKRAHEAEKENIDPLTTEALQPRPRSGRPFALDERDERQLIRHATKNKLQRRKPWSKIAQELGIAYSISAINSAFYRNGYGRYPPLYKPLLKPEQQRKRLKFCNEWKDILKGKEHMIVFCDETTIRVRDHRGQNWITRLKSERYHPDYIESRYKGFTELMF